MTTILTPATPMPAAKPPLITRPLLLRFVSVAGSSVSFYLPLSVVPRYAASSGSDAGAGLLVAHTGYPAAFGLTAALIIPALLLTRRERTTPGQVPKRR